MNNPAAMRETLGRAVSSVAHSEANTNHASDSIRAKEKSSGCDFVHKLFGESSPNVPPVELGVTVMGGLVAFTSSRPSSEGSQQMAETQDTFVRATDELIALYRSVERRTLDLPWLSLMPFVRYLWELTKFYFFFMVGFFLIIPVNVVILIRNLFPGHWHYRPFFLRQLKYICLWVWRGEVPFTPSLFIRPLFISFMKAHFESRLLRLRREIILRDDISEPTRGALTARLDAVIENWKYPRIATLFFTVLLPAIASLPTWSKQFKDSLEFLGVHIPIETAETFVSQMSSSAKILWVMGILAYLLSVPTAAFMAKRGLFIGREPNDICFPGGQDGGELYFGERKILASVGLHA